MMPSLCDVDPFAALEQEAARQAAAEKATKAIAGACVRLILGRDGKSAFFATLALRLKLAVDWDVETMAVDGRSLFFNPQFVNGLASPDELLGVLVHETMHLAMAHHARQGDRDTKRWNIATDASINGILLRAGFVLPPGRLMAGEGSLSELPPDLSAEAYYSMLPAPPEAEQGKDGDGGRGDDPGGCGSVRKPGSQAECSDSQAEWAAAVVQAEQAAKGRGELPAGLARAVGNAVHPPACWKAILREFISATAKSDWTWSRPNRRHVWKNLFLPGLYSEELGTVVVAIDTSGSIGEAELNVFASELEAILGAFACTAHIIYHDSEVTRVDEWTSSDGPLTLNPVGGGGTSHVPVFAHIEASGWSPACVVALSDMDSEFPPDPGIPTLWAVVGGNRSTPPFGRVVHLSS